MRISGVCIGMAILTACFARTAFADDTSWFRENFSYWMEIAYNGEYDSCKMVIDNLYVLATNKKIWGNDNQTMDVITYLGQLGSEMKVKTTTGSQDFASIRMKSAQTLGAIGGDYARVCVIRIVDAEKYTANVSVITACLNALKRLGNDKSNSALKTIRFIYDYMPKQETGEEMESLNAYIQCADQLAKNAPMNVVTAFEIIASLNDLNNEDSNYRVYPQEIRRAAKAALIDIAESRHETNVNAH